MAVEKKANPVVIRYQIERNKVWFKLFGVFFCEKECGLNETVCSKQCEKCENHYTDLLK